MWNILHISLHFEWFSLLIAKNLPIENRTSKEIKQIENFKSAIESDADVICHKNYFCLSKRWKVLYLFLVESENFICAYCEMLHSNNTLARFHNCRLFKSCELHELWNKLFFNQTLTITFYFRILSHLTIIHISIAKNQCKKQTKPKSHTIFSKSKKKKYLTFWTSIKCGSICVIITSNQISYRKKEQSFWIAI